MTHSSLLQSQSSPLAIVYPESLGSSSLSPTRLSQSSERTVVDRNDTLQDSCNSNTTSEDGDQECALQRSLNNHNDPNSKSEPISLPVFRVMVLASALFCNTFMASMLLPFLSFMVSDFGIAPTPKDIGKYSGYLVSSYMVGQFLFSYRWGYMSDVYGRRPILIIGLLLTGTSFLIFGFSKTYTMALASRFANGLVNGIMGVCMTYMSEITNETNQGSGFAILGTARASGIVLGPIVGGFLSAPSTKYPKWFPKKSLFDIYPYSLPCMIGFSVATTGGILAIAVLKETKILASHTDLPTHSTAFPVQDQDECISAETEQSTERSPLLSASAPLNPTRIQHTQPEPILQLLRSLPVFLTISLYTNLNSTYIQYDELFSIWSRLPPSQGGLGFTSSDQGTGFAIGGACLFIYQIFIYSHVERHFGTLQTFRIGALISLPGFALLSFATNYSQTNRTFMWCMVAVAQITRTVGGLQAFTSMFVMISNSVLPRSRGSVNGFAQTFGAFGKMIGPIIAGNGFSWSLQNSLGPPFDYRFMFLMLIFQQIVTLLLSLGLDKSINHRLSEEQDIME
ncbi:hypothetical protein BDEG_20626 [Batrachochytrium dendrobatidis JEL423]|uniref:Major facilitator superfamily (MFS) profile domain-containing protein n=1 Tax=Batrachochytrium dendrobatidis (strain JEL423) TaxID=403673 RepID=A0A177W9N2_BATDL|nr:hypothetical protein BDEG_20626 [Batrachochytrium dendrobatidis JEL423]